MAPSSDRQESEVGQPDEKQTHRRTFEAGFGDEGFSGFTDLVVANTERLANRVERPCRVEVTIEVYDLDDEGAVE